MKRRIVFATGNENKMKEIRMILADLNMEIISMKEAGLILKSWKTGCPLKKMRRSRQDPSPEC